MEVFVVLSLEEVFGAFLDVVLGVVSELDWGCERDREEDREEDRELGRDCERDREVDRDRDLERDPDLTEDFVFVDFVPADLVEVREA